MFPTFISILDIQSWWEVPSIAHFCSLFRTAFNLLDFDIEDLEEALLTDGTEETSWLQELIVRLLSGCIPNNEISTFNYQMFLRRLFRQKCQEHDQYNPFNTDVDFQLLPLRTKVDILHALCDFRLDADDVLDQLKNLEADSLRVEPLGYDNNESAYWYFYGTRLYREDFKTKNNKKKSVWQVICFTEDDWYQLNKKFKKSTAKCERQLYRTLSENFLPELPRLFREKERLARKRLLENQPRRTSRRLRKDVLDKEEENCDIPRNIEEEEKQRKRDLEVKRREAYERRSKLKEQSEDSESDRSESRYEMGGAKARQKKSKGRQRKLSTSSSNSKDAVSAPKSSKRKKTNEDTSKSSSSSATTTVGRQTNNSLAAATGQIVIQPVANSTKKKLKTSQVFRQTDEDLVTGMHKILDYVKNHEDAWPFADPVDEEYAPNYYSVIRKPMDLQRMEERLDAGYYKNFAKFREDFQLIVDNCRLYNGAENEYTEMVDNLSKVFDRATEKFLDQISSSDDEIAVEFPKAERDSKEPKKSGSKSPSKSSKRKPTLAAKTDRKREHSLSEESLDKRSLSYDSNDEEKSPKKEKIAKKHSKISKKEKSETKKSKDKKNSKSNSSKHKKEKCPSPVRSRSVSRNSLIRSYSSSPPPSSAPSSPDNRFDFFPKKQYLQNKQKNKKELFEQEDTNSCDTKTTLPTKPKDKHNKLRETIEKLKAKSEISNKLNDDEFCFDLDTPKENKEKSKKKKEKVVKKKDVDFEDSNSTMESIQTTTKSSKKNAKNSKIDALTIATEQTLKDINKWLDDTPKFSEFSSASNSPCYPPLDDFDINRVDKKIDKSVNIKKDKDVKRRTFTRDPAKFLKRREVQRTIDRLQPGKSKGNLISNVQPKQTDELFPLGPLTKNKDSKNSLIVKTDDNAPKLSLGSVLDSFGRHKFNDDNVKTENEDKKDTLTQATQEVKEEVKPEESQSTEESSSTSMMSGATPNLSAWFKAFGAPKVQSSQKKTETSKPETKEINEEKSKEETKVPVPELSPNTPVPRQRKVSTGSSVSERSSFSQDMDSPRVGIDERLGAYPAPYPSPLHRSPSGASPVRPELSPKAPYPPFNGQIRVGFYQDTVSNKSSPDKSCSPRDNPQSPYPQCTSEHVYTQNVPYSYPNSPYPNYSNTNPTPPYNSENSYYDTNKSLTDQYHQAKSTQNYNVASPSPAETFRQEDPKITEKVMFPVKKRAYNETELTNESDYVTPDPKPQTNTEPLAQPQQMPSPAMTYSSPSNNYNNNYANNESNYSLNIPTRSLPNMGYTGPEINFSRGMPQPQYTRPELTYTRPPSTTDQPQPQPTSEPPPHYPSYQQAPTNQQQAHSNYANNGGGRLPQPQPTYNTHLDMDQPLGLRGNIANLSHIVDRYNNDERMLSGLQSSAGQYYGDKGLGTSHMFNKPICTSSSGLPIFNQANIQGIQSYNQNVQVATSSMYNRQISELQSTQSGGEVKNVAGVQQSTGEKKSKKRKSSKTAQAVVPSADSPAPATSQGFQSYAGLKSNPPMEPSAISLKTASVVPGSAFNFGPSPSALGLGSGLYGDKDAYPNFLEDFRAAPNYYIAAATAAHHRSTPEAPDKQTRMAAHQSSTRQPASYPFIGARQATPPSYPLGSHFMPSAQAPLMDASSPLYQHYLQAGVLNQGLLGPPGPYGPGYHPALSMRQPYDSMTRPPWL